MTMAISIYADTDLDHGSEVNADAIRDAEKATDTALDKTIENTKDASFDTDLDHGSEVNAGSIRDAEKATDTALDKTIKNTDSAAK